MAIESITYHGDGEFKSAFIGDSKLDDERVVEKYRKATSRFKTPIHIHLQNGDNKNSLKFNNHDKYNIDTSEGIHLGLTGNFGGPNPLPLTPWIIIHRPLHWLIMTNVHQSRFNNIIDLFEYEKILYNEIIANHKDDLSILNKSNFISGKLSSFKNLNVKKINIDLEKRVNETNFIKYDKFNDIIVDELSMRFHHYVYTMKSARDSALYHPDRINECICQYIFTGKVTIRHPDTFPEGLVSKEVYDKLISIHEDFENYINDYCKNILEYIEKEDILAWF